jgi:signal transduction histidine kinase/ligand-binding sensor domain-containing protein
MDAWRTKAATSLAILLCCARTASALNPALDVSQYAHTAWTIREGFFSNQVSSIAQTPDGYLWLGTESGLLRFDGVRVVRWQPRGGGALPSTRITNLLVSQDGRLWIATSAGLASLKDDRLVSYPELAGELVASLAEDSTRTVWAGTIGIPHARLCAIRGAVECVAEDGRLGVGVFSLFDDAGTLWVGAASGLWRWTPGDPIRYAPIPNIHDLVKLSDGRLLVVTSDAVRQLIGDRLEAYPIAGIDRPLGAGKLVLDREGSIWIGTRAGLVHVHDGRVDLFKPSDGLSGDQVVAIVEDREGNVWVATNEGLDRFRELAITRLTDRQGMPAGPTSSVLQARDQSVWIGTTAGLTRWKDGRTTIYRKREGLPEDRIGTLFEDSVGRIFVATLGGMAVFDQKRFAPVRSLSTRIVYGIAEEGPGEFWISDQENGLIHLVAGQVVTRTPWPALGHKDHATALVFDRTRAGLWLGFYNGGVAFVQDAITRESYAAADGLGSGRVAQMRIAPDGAIWAATAAGLSRINKHRVTTLTAKNGLPCDSVHWTIEDADRSLWLSMSCGLVRISSDEFAAWRADASRSVNVTVFDSSDGVRSLATPIGFSPPAAITGDGRLWFATANGVGLVDPRRLPFNTLSPTVVIEQVVADGRDLDMLPGDSHVILPALTRDLRIDYTGLSLVAPEKVRFRYLLEGHDRDWQDAGNRRQAFYGNLPPRKYRFRVIASNNSGVWNETGASLDLSVAPAYYQTAWFKALSLASLIALVWGGHRLRLRIVERHRNEISALNERMMKAQEQERIRIAGELHDGVMQDMLAVTMMLGTVKRQIHGDQEATTRIEKAQEKLVQAGTDLRQLSHDLHPPLLQEAGLPKAVRAYCDQFNAASNIPVACDADEDLRDLSRGAALALFRIVQEALGNAAKHASAKQITVRLSRSNGMVSLMVSDDGIGLDPGRLASGGGLGLVMMRERATQLNGRFEFESVPGRGTTIRVLIAFR